MLSAYWTIITSNKQIIILHKDSFRIYPQILISENINSINEEVYYNRLIFLKIHGLWDLTAADTQGWTSVAERKSYTKQESRCGEVF